ncbi:MAG: glycosyltransferase [Bacteroidales bacterium]|nr:glycosyltransferase [Bacteroidales bacterium]
MGKARVLYISYDGMTDNLGQSQVIPYLIGLTQKGYSITILSCEKPLAFEQREKHISALLKKNDISWEPIPYTAKPPIFSTLYDIRMMQKKAKEIVVKQQIELVHCRSYISAHIGRFCQKEFGIPWVFDMRGFWADERVEGGIWNTSKWMYRLVYNYFKNAEKEFITKSNYIISLTKNGAEEIQSWTEYQQAKTPIQVIPCCADLHLFRYNKNLDSVRKKLHISESNFVVSYLGSFGTWYMTEEMFDFFKVLYEKNNNAVFLCITPDNPDKLDSIAIRKDIPRSALRVVKANREDVPLYASLSNWSLFFIKPVYSKKASSPTKMGELLSLGIPLVCNGGVGDVDTIMKDCDQGYVVNSFTENEYAAVAEKILLDLNPNREKLRSVAEKYYSLERGVELYEEVYRNCLSD